MGTESVIPMLLVTPARSHNPVATAGSAHPGRTRRAVVLKHARDTVAANDGMRVLVDRLWPRGIAKEHLTFDLWLKEVAPSSLLRRWYGHEPSRWTAFTQRYRTELAQRGDLLLLLDDLRRRGRLTLLYDAHDPLHNNAAVLRQVLMERRFLRHIPKGVGP